MKDSYPMLFKVMVENPGPAFIASLLEALQLDFAAVQGEPYPQKHIDCDHRRFAAQGSLARGYIHTKAQYCPRCYPDGPVFGLEWTHHMLMIEAPAGSDVFDTFHNLYQPFTQQEKIS